MSLDRSGLSADECYVTALQIFDYCGGESTGTLRVDSLMDKFAPFVKTNKAEYSHLRSLLDPEDDNPEISVTMLANTLRQYSENQKSKVNLDESFNMLMNGQTPQDSDSGISGDGFQLLEELQSELREKAHLAHQLRSQLDFTDRQHEEALAVLTAERDTLREHLTIIREENMSLAHVRRDYEDLCERLSSNDRALDETRRELEAFRRRNKVMVEQVAALENEKLTLQELLSKSKAECHRINEMYAGRQSALLEQNEALRSDHADLSARLQDQEEFVQQIIKEKVLLEMELKDMLNKSNHNQLVMDRSIDVSYTDDQMLTVLDSLNADSRFSQDNQILDEELFVKALKDQDQGRATNLSLFDEIRLSFCNMSRSNTGLINDRQHDSFSCDKTWDNSFAEIETQTDFELYDAADKAHIETQTDIEMSEDGIRRAVSAAETQTDLGPYDVTIKAHSCSPIGTQIDFRRPLLTHETQTEPSIFLTIGTQTKRELCIKRDNVQIPTPVSSIAVAIQTENEPKMGCSKVQNLRTIETQTLTDLTNNNNTATKCLECEKNNKYTAKLERDAHATRYTLSEMQLELDRYESNLDILQKYIEQGNEKNNVLQTVIKNLQEKIGVMEEACVHQKERLDSLTQEELSLKAMCDLSTVATQTDIPCLDCEKRKAVVPHRSLRKFFWRPLKCLFQLFAVMCFICAVSVLYGVTSRARAVCPRDVIPWRWMDAQEVLDLLLRIEYVADVPM